MKSLLKEHLFLAFLFFSSFLYSQVEGQKNIPSLGNTELTGDGVNQQNLHPQNEILIRQLEGVNFSYVMSPDSKNCTFIIKNSSGNSMKISWDIKLFYSNENDSKEIHKEIMVLPKENLEIYAIDKSTLLLSSKSTEIKNISRLEVYNVRFKGGR